MFINGFLEDATANGIPLQGVMWDATETARLHGVTYIVVDNFKSEDMPDDKGAAISERKYPYVYKKLASQVDSFETDNLGNLEEIVFCEDSVKNELGHTEKRYGKWTALEYAYMKKGEDKQYITLWTNVHGLGVLPVVPEFAVRRKDQKNIMVDPPLYDIAKVNHAIFNKHSEIRDQERAQGFSMFYIQTDSPGSAVVSGTHNVLWIPQDASIPPGFASPNPAILDGLVKNNEGLSAELYKLAGQNGVTGVVKQESGIAKEWDFRSESTVLTKTSRISEDAELKVIEIFKLYTGEEFDYTVKYPDEFQPSNDTQAIVDSQALLDMGMPQKASSLIKKQNFKAWAVDKYDEDIIDDAADEFDDMEHDSFQSEVDNDFRKTLKGTSENADEAC